MPKNKALTPRGSTDLHFYRVHAWLPGAVHGENGHPLFVWPRQGSGRIDNPDHYLTLYVGDSPPGAVAEAWGNHSAWTSGLLEGPPSLPGSVRALTEYEGAPSILDLDDAHTLAAQGLRPSRIVTRQISHTQAWALALHLTVGVAGVQWWSYHDPDWGSMGLWDYSSLSVVKTTPLSQQHAAVIAAGKVLSRRWT